VAQLIRVGVFDFAIDLNQRVVVADFVGFELDVVKSVHLFELLIERFQLIDLQLERLARILRTFGHRLVRLYVFLPRNLSILWLENAADNQKLFHV
jgi:hypothetical protein